MKPREIPKIIYFVLVIALIAIGFVIFTQTKSPAQKEVPPPINPLIPESSPSTITQVATSSESTTTQPATSLKSQEVKILSPAKGDKWKRGETYEIRWTPSDPEGIVTIRLINTEADISALRLVFETPYPIPNTGSYLFTVPSKMKPRDSYQFELTIFYEKEMKKGESEIFSIIE